MSGLKTEWLNQYFDTPPRVLFDVVSYDAGDAQRLLSACPVLVAWCFKAAAKNVVKVLSQAGSRLHVVHVAVGDEVGEVTPNE